MIHPTAPDNKISMSLLQDHQLTPDCDFPIPTSTLTPPLSSFIPIIGPGASGISFFALSLSLRESLSLAAELCLLSSTRSLFPDFDAPDCTSNSSLLFVTWFSPPLPDHAERVLEDVKVLFEEAESRRMVRARFGWKRCIIPERSNGIR